MQQTEQPDDRTLLDWVLEHSVRVGPNHARGGNGFRAYLAGRGKIIYLPGEGKTKREAAATAWQATQGGSRAETK